MEGEGWETKADLREGMGGEKGKGMHGWERMEGERKGILVKRNDRNDSERK